MFKVELIPDYEECGTCGYDHAYDMLPGVSEKIREAHKASKDASPDLAPSQRSE